MISWVFLMTIYIQITLLYILVLECIIIKYLSLLFCIYFLYKNVKEVIMDLKTVNQRIAEKRTTNQRIVTPNE